VTPTTVRDADVNARFDPYMSLTKLAEYAGLGRRTRRRYLELPPDEALPCYRLPGRGKIVVRTSEFDAWISRHRALGRPAVFEALRQWGLIACDATPDPS
jgi:hypothetical protein